MNVSISTCVYIQKCVYLGGNLGGAQAGARVVVLLVRLVGALGVADLLAQVGLVLLVVVVDALPVGPLRVGVDVHLDDAITGCVKGRGCLLKGALRA